jgi:hydroxymethylbilane synthase
MSDAAKSSPSLRLGTRASLLARTQSQMVADELTRRHRGLRVELVFCKTTGDKIQDRPLHEAGGKGLFTKELEEALLAGTVDFAVHSFKDVPVTMPLVDQSNLIIAAVPTREGVCDVMVSTKAKSIDGLPRGAKVGTGSLRRRCQLLAIRPDLNVEPIRGNVDTRIRKQREGQCDAVILAMAGLKRSALFDQNDMTPIPLEQVLPAAAQGALAIQCRREDVRTMALLGVLSDPVSFLCVRIERSVVAALNGDCHSPIAALATVEAGIVHLRVAVGARGGELPLLRAEASAEVKNAEEARDRVIKSLEGQGVRELLAGAASR